MCVTLNLGNYPICTRHINFTEILIRRDLPSVPEKYSLVISSTHLASLHVSCFTVGYKFLMNRHLEILDLGLRNISSYKLLQVVAIAMLT